MSTDKTASVLRILLVEDNEHDRIAFHRAFRKSEVTCEIKEYVRAEEALEQLRSGTQAFNIVVADYKLPGMSGLDLFRRMREEDIRTPFVMLTGTGLEQFAVEALQAGVDDYIIKDTAQAYSRLLPVVIPEVIRRHNDRLARQDAEEALQLSEEKLRMMFDSMSDLMIVTDLQGNITEVNSATLQVHGFAGREKMVGLNCSSFVAGKDRDRAMGLWAGALRGESSQVEEIALLDKRGHEIPVELCAAVLRHKSGNPVGFVVVGRDITEHKQAEHDISERVKELQCLYGIAAIAETPGITLEVIYQKVADILPESWQYPEITCTRIAIGADEFKTEDYRETKWKQSSDIRIHEIREGEVEVGYLEEKPEIDEGPFMKEERMLIDAVAERIGRIAERKRAEQELERLNLILRTIRNVNQLIARENNRDRLLKEICDNLIENRSYYNCWIALLDESGGLAATSEVGLGEKFLPMAEQLKRGQLPSCGQKALTQSEAVIIEDPLSYCTDCPLMKEYSGRGAITARLKHGEKVYGLLSASIPAEFTSSSEERVLFEEVAGDIAYALHKMELEEDHMRADEVLRESEEKYRIMAATVNDGVFTLDLEGKFSYFNRKFEEVSGCTQEDLIGQHFSKIVAPEYIKSTVARFRRGISGGEIPLYEIELLCKDGKRIPIELNMKSMLDTKGRVIGRIGAARDITERKKAEAELTLRAQLLDNVSDLVNLTDLDGSLVYINEAACKAYGYSREEFLGMNIHEIITPDYVGVVEWRVQELMKKGHVVFESANFRKDSSIIPVEVNASLIEVGGKKFVLSVDRDITERKRMEAERKEMEQKAQVSSRLSTIGELASGMAHEINNPLVSVVGFSQLMMERGDLPEEVRERLGLINTGGMRIASIVERLISFARRQKLERAYTSINDTIEEVIGLRAYEMKAGNIEVSTQLDPDLPWTVADAGQLQQVFLNIVINAEKEMKEAHGGGKLSIKTEAIDKTIRISFKDDGPGIAKENLERIFDPFFTTREVGEGAGLGLSICHGIIAEHNGWIYASSKRRKGATIIVELPVITADREQKRAQPVAKEPAKAASAKILVVDDEVTNLQLISSVLTGEGYEVETVDNAGDALEMIKKGGYDLSLLDIKIPGMSGKELYKAIQDMSPAMADRVVFVTGDILGEGTRDFLSKTGAPYINKPFDNEELKRIVNRVLAKGL